LAICRALSRLRNLAVLRWGFLLEDAHEFAHPGRIVGPGAGRNHCSVYYRFGIDEGSSRSLYIGFKRRIRGGSSAFEHTCSGQNKRSMAELGDWLLAIEEVSDDALAVRIVADVLRCAPAGYHQSRVRGWINVSEG